MVFSITPKAGFDPALPVKKVARPVRFGGSRQPKADKPVHNGESSGKSSLRNAAERAWDGVTFVGAGLLLIPSVAFNVMLCAVTGGRHGNGVYIPKGGGPED